MKTNTRLQQIREAERKSHIEIYSDKNLYESGSWLAKPIKTVLDLIPMFKNYQQLRILDLGSGVGRNSIAFAREYQNISCTVECVDILDLAIKKLEENAGKFNVASSVKGIIAPIEEYPIAENAYDVIMAVSALEHVESEAIFLQMLKKISRGITENGVVCLVINSNVVEMDKVTGNPLEPQFEVNLDTELLQKMLEGIFGEWEKIKTLVSVQKYDIPRDNSVVDLTSNVVTFVARKRN